MEAIQTDTATTHTRWSMIRAAKSEDESVRAAALEYLFRRYAPTLRVFVIQRFDISPTDAEDLIQDFLIARIFHNSLLETADQTRGRFRNFLMRSVSRFTIDRLRANSAAKRQPSEGATSLEYMMSKGWSPRAETDDSIFDEAFTRQLISDAIRATQRHCLNAGREDLWVIFENRVLGPAMNNQPPTDYEHLCAQIGVITPPQAQNLLVSGKRIFKREFRSIVEDYTTSPEEVEEELRFLRNFLD